MCASISFKAKQQCVVMLRRADGSNKKVKKAKKAPRSTGGATAPVIESTRRWEPRQRERTHPVNIVATRRVGFGWPMETNSSKVIVLTSGVDNLRQGVDRPETLGFGQLRHED